MACSNQGPSRSPPGLPGAGRFAWAIRFGVQPRGGGVLRGRPASAAAVVAARFGKDSQATVCSSASLLRVMEQIGLLHTHRLAIPRCSRAHVRSAIRPGCGGSPQAGMFLRQQAAPHWSASRTSIAPLPVIPEQPPDLLGSPAPARCAIPPPAERCRGELPGAGSDCEAPLR